MKISVVQLLTNPDETNYPWRESLESVLSWADEVVIVNGGKELDYSFMSELDNLVEVKLPWPKEFNWSHFAKALHAGVLASSGDWLMRVEADYVFMDGVKDKVISALQDADFKGMKVAAFQKVCALTSKRFYYKGNMDLAINRGRYGFLTFGADYDEYTDLCQPIDMREMRDGVPYGLAVKSDIYITHVNVYNYDYTFRTEEMARSEFYRFSKAHKRHFGETKWGNTPQESFNYFIYMMTGRYNRSSHTILEPGDQPEAVRYKILDLQPEQFGYNWWGRLDE